MSDETKPEYKCSFCHKLGPEVTTLIAGRDDGAFICNECIGLSRDIVLRRDDPVARANLRIAAFAALKGWGSTGHDGKWKSWNWNDLCAHADRLVVWSLGDVKKAGAA